MSAYRILSSKTTVQILCQSVTVAESIMLPVALSPTYYYRTQFEDFYEANYHKYLKSTPQLQQEHTVIEQSYIMRFLQA